MVTDVNQQARKAPLPCYGLEFSVKDPRCLECRHRVTCWQAMGVRYSHVPLSKLQFKLVPDLYNLVYETVEFEDPDIANMERTYALCFQTIFRKNPKDKIRDRDGIANAARRHECSIRLYMLAVMAAYRAHCVIIAQHGERSKPAPFTSKLLTGKIARKRFDTFRDLCAKEFGAFSLGSIGTLLNYDFEKNSPEQKILDSEIKAGQCIIDFKMTTGGPYFEHLYKQCELTLDPLWLAIEQSYLETVLNPYREKPRGTEAEKIHRHAASLAIQRLKKQNNTAIMLFQAREAIMAKATTTVLRFFGYGPDDFLMIDAPVTDCLGYWNAIALAVQHDECLRYVDGLNSRILRS